MLMYHIAKSFGWRTCLKQILFQKTTAVLKQNHFENRIFNLLNIVQFKWKLPDDAKARKFLFILNILKLRKDEQSY